MGYDRQTSPFATRLYLTCYCLFLLLNVLLHATTFGEQEKENCDGNPRRQVKAIVFGAIATSAFALGLYGLWFARVTILCCIGLVFSLLLGISFVSLVLLTSKFIIIDYKNMIQCNSTRTDEGTPYLYFAHNYVWLIKASTLLSRFIGLTFSCLFGIIGLWAVCHLYSCMDIYRDFWLYRLRRRPTPQIFL